MKPADVRRQIESGETAPLYLLEGDDLQSRHDLAVEFASLVDEGLHAFNVQSFYANEATSTGARDQMIGELLAAARTLPMMAPRRILVVHEAERLLSPRKSKDDDDEPVAAAGGKKKKSLTPLEELEQYIQTPEPLTTLVFVAGDLDGNRRLVKLVRKHAAVVDCGTLENDGEAAKWIKAWVEKNGCQIDAKAINALLGSTGRSLGRIRAELEKLALYAAGEKAITVQHVQDMMLPSETPGDGPAVGWAIRDGDARRALREVTIQLDAGLPHLPILGQIRWGVGLQRPESRVKRGLELVLETDLAIKSSSGEPRFLIEKLVIDLCAR